MNTNLHQRWEIWGRHNDQEEVMVVDSPDTYVFRKVDHWGPAMRLAVLKPYDNHDDFLAEYQLEHGDQWHLWLEHFPVPHPHFKSRRAVEELAHA